MRCSFSAPAVELHRYAFRPWRSRVVTNNIAFSFRIHTIKENNSVISIMLLVFEKCGQVWS